MEEPCYELRVRGKEVLQCCWNAVLQFKNIRLEWWKKMLRVTGYELEKMNNGKTKMME